MQYRPIRRGLDVCPSHRAVEKRPLGVDPAANSSQPTRIACWFAVCVFVLFVLVEGRAEAQPDAAEHESHHPEAGPPSGAAKGPQGAMGEMGGMESMMERMGVPPPREFYPEMMRLEELTLKREHELRAKAQERGADGSERLSEGLAELDRGVYESDEAAVVEGLAEARAGLDELESALAAERALANGVAPRKVALDWFRDEMRLPEAASTDAGGLFGLGWFHAFVMALLTLFAVIMIVMYFHKMRRASALLAELAGSTTSPVSPTSVARQPPPTPASPSGPDNSAAIFEALRKTGSCSGCKNPCAVRMRVAQIFEEAQGVKTFRIAPVDGGPLPFEYLPGQFLNVLVPLGGEAGGDTRRSYTIASAPTQAAYCEITVKRESDGLVSRYLHDRLRRGDELRIAAPYGRFTFTGDEASSIVLIGGGVGITPLMSVLRYLTDSSWGGDITLFFGFETPEHFVFRNELERLESRHPNLRVIPVVARPEGTDWQGRSGFIGPELVRQVVPDIADRSVHVCGPRPMMHAAREFLAELGVVQGRLRMEFFGPEERRSTPARLDQIDAAHAPKVEFTRSGKSAPLPAELTILDVADAIGVEIESSCRSGTCGSCAVKLVGGDVTMEVDDGLDAEDRERGMVLACQARATVDVAVEA